MSVTDAAGHVTKYSYDAAGDMTSSTDPRGNKFIENEYDANDRVAVQRTADGGTFGFDYSLNEAGEATATTVTEPSGSKRRVTFSEEGFPTSESLAVGTPLEQTTTIEREAGTGRVLSETDTRGRKTTFGYDPYGNVTEVTRLAGTSAATTTKYEYEPDTTNLVKETDPLGHSTSFEYGGSGELRKATDPDGHTTSYVYNSEGLCTKETNARNDSTTYEYADGALIAITDPLGRRSSQFADAIGRVARTTTPEGGRTFYTYDGDDNITSVTDPRNDTTILEYNADNELSTITDPRGDKLTIAYNAMDRIESETDALGHAAKWTYNSSGAPIEMVDRDGHRTILEYDALARLSRERFGVSGETAESQISYGYDNGNRLTHVTDTASGEYTLSYNELDQLTETKAPSGSLSYTYDAAGRRTTMTVPGLEPVEYTYDANGHLTELTRGSAHVKLDYDQANELTEVTLPDAIMQHYTYDGAGEPTAISYIHSGSTLGEIDDAYDQNGEPEATWGSFARVGLPEPVTSASYNADNEQTKFNGASLAYDADGNLTSDGTSEYKWNGRGQLTTITGPDPASYGYDAFGRRTSKTLGGVTTRLLLDGENPALETEGTKPAHSFLTGFGPNQVFSRTSEGVSESYLTDTLGSTIALANPSASIATSYTYTPFGASSLTGAPSENPFQFDGRENDGNGLQYNLARYYAPGYSRFISMDPLGNAGSGFNHYQYAWDAPTIITDPTGASGTGSRGLFAGVTSLIGLHPNFCIPGAPELNSFINWYLQGEIFGPLSVLGADRSSLDSLGDVAGIVSDSGLPPSVTLPAEVFSDGLDAVDAIKALWRGWQVASEDENGAP